MELANVIEADDIDESLAGRRNPSHQNEAQIATATPSMIAVVRAFERTTPKQPQSINPVTDFSSATANKHKNKTDASAQLSR